MKYLVTGGSGQVGFDVVQELIARYGSDAEIYVPTHAEMDIVNEEETYLYIKSVSPDVIFHCAAYTRVDDAEKDCKTCFDINVNGTKNIVKVAEEVGSKLIYVSTDYVFDGTKHLYKVDDEAHPINVYGETKLLGEQIVEEYEKHFIVRTSWVFGNHGNSNFIKTMLRLAETRKEVTVVSDQVGSPTYSKDLARLLVDLSETNKYGKYHGSNEGYTSWYDFAKYIFEEARMEMNVLPIKTEDYKTDARRPLNTCLDKSSVTDAGFELLPKWEDAVNRYLGESLKNNKDLRKKVQ
ncbi:MAG: dTDP-4-dehydrorhamnose reductase [Erysipelotrichales bacterium]|nr:dTDP-4-dehydrorhamnose reductase [Erysipelotrichales bacterium]